MKKLRTTLLLIILIGFGLRLLRLGEQSLWYDEGITWLLSQMNLPDLIAWTAADIQPPLYYLLIWLTDILYGDSEWALRFPSVLFSTLTIAAIASLARRLLATTRLSLSRTTAWLAAGLVAISPLMIYYSQEARMYTLLALEATLSGYLLLRLLSPSLAAPLRVAVFYSLTAAAALYTHYFAAFLLVAHTLFGLLALWQQRFPKAQTMALLGSLGGVALLFAPWLPTLLARLGDDPSYWPGALKIDEAVRELLISYTAGETVFEQMGWRLALVCLGLLLLAALWLLIDHRLGAPAQPTPADKAPLITSYASPLTPYSLLPISYAFLFLWLLLPPALILLLSYQSPKFNPRYALLSWPAFALLAAILLAQLLRSARTGPAPRRYLSGLLGGLTALSLVAASAYSLTNWFTDARFSKDDFQALAQFVRERKAPDETVLLSSGHLFPVWAYYYGWEGWTPLPWMLRLDVNRVTGLDIAADIAAAIEAHQGVWLVTWQDEVIDPNGVVPFWLDLIGERPRDAGDFWGVGLEHWRLKPDSVERLQENPIAHPLAYNFNNQVDLIGMTQLSDEELVLFWQPRAPLPNDLLLTLDLTDPDGFDWDRETVIGRPGAYLYPPARWPVAGTIITRHALPWQIGAPPGLYVAEVGLGVADEAGGAFTGWDILDAQQRPQRRTARVNYVNLGHLVQPAGGPLPLDKDPLVDFFPIIALRRSILPQPAAQPGDRLLLALLWQAGEYNVDDVSLAFDLIDSQGETFRVGYALTPSRQFNLPRWQPGDVVLGQYWLDIPPEAAPGPAVLQLHIINVSGWPYDETFAFDEITIQPTQRNFSPPATVDFPIDADFSGQTTLLGLDCPNQCQATPGQTVSLTLYWQAGERFDAGYTIFTHLLDAGETVLVNADHAPPKPTTGWVSGEVITDPVSLPLPPDIPPGRYALEVGLYNAADPNFTRLPLTGGETRVLLPDLLDIK